MYNLKGVATVKILCLSLILVARGLIPDRKHSRQTNHRSGYNTNQSLFILSRRAKRQARGPLKNERARAQREENLSAKIITFLVILDISF